MHQWSQDPLEINNTLEVFIDFTGWKQFLFKSIIHSVTENVRVSSQQQYSTKNKQQRFNHVEEFLPYKFPRA